MFNMTSFTASIIFKLLMITSEKIKDLRCVLKAMTPVTGIDLKLLSVVGICGDVTGSIQTKMTTIYRDFLSIIFFFQYLYL